MMWVSSLSLLKGEVWDTKTPENDLTLNIYTADCTACCPEMLVLLSDLDSACLPFTEEVSPLAAWTNTTIIRPYPTSSDCLHQIHPHDEELKVRAPSDTRRPPHHIHSFIRLHPPIYPNSSTYSDSPTRPESHTTTRYESSYETPSPSSSPTLPIRKRYRGTSKLVEDTEDESSNAINRERGVQRHGGSGSERRRERLTEVWQQAILVVDTATDEPLGLGYRALRRRELALRKGSVPSTFRELRTEFRSVSDTAEVRGGLHAPRHRFVLQVKICGWHISPSSLAVPTSVASPADSSLVASPATVEAKTFLTELGAHVELQGGLIHDHTQHLDALPLALFESYDRDLRELYTSDLWRPERATTVAGRYVDQ
ncbi:hypothetical protein Tco_0285834 [Tanacetum coccineum]